MDSPGQLLHRFCRYELRTVDVDAARAFYLDVFGGNFWGRGIEVAQLPAEAAARGAPAHWLGHVGVEDVVGMMYRWLEAGATRLGPPPAETGAGARAILRDPFGAIVALLPAAPLPDPDRVAWHLLTTRDEERAVDTYAGILGWSRRDAIDLGARRGRHVHFGWDADDDDEAGSVSDLARLPHVHAQWLYFFRTDHLDEALARVEAQGGLPLPATETVEGHRVAACDDPQGAAFGIFEDRRR